MASPNMLRKREYHARKLQRKAYYPKLKKIRGVLIETDVDGRTYIRHPNRKQRKRVVFV